MRTGGTAGRGRPGDSLFVESYFSLWQCAVGLILEGVRRSAAACYLDLEPVCRRQAFRKDRSHSDGVSEAGDSSL